MNIIDTHLHLWELDRLRLPWLDNEGSVLKRNYTLQDYTSSTTCNIEQAVYVEVDVAPEDRGKENQMIEALCKSPDCIVNGAVISGSMDSPDFEAYLEQYGGEWLKGVRHVLHVPSSPPKACLQTQFIKNVQLLGDKGLHFEACLRCDELSDLVKLARECPNTSIVLNHIGIVNADIVANPDASENGREYLEQWKENMRLLAAMDNVVCKVSGLNPSGAWDVETLRPSVDIAFDIFGEDKVMFASNYPVCQISTGLMPWINALIVITEPRGKDFQNKLFHHNAKRVYRLK